MDLSENERSELRSYIRSDGYDGSVSARAQIVMWYADGHRPADIARMAGTSRPTVYKWVDRYACGGVAALDSRKPTGRPREVSEEIRSHIIALTRQTPPADTGLSHWSSSEMAKYLRRVEGISVSHNFVATLWREQGLAPHRHRGFKLSTDPAFTEKVVDVVGLYLHPPEGAVVLSVDEKTQVQAIERTQPVVPVDFAMPEKHTHDYVRHGTTNLFAALNTATGEVQGTCLPRRRTREFLAFMEQVTASYGDQKLHVIVDNLSTHSGPDVTAWLTRHPGVTFHFTPTGSSWLNQIEIWFGIITRQAIQRGTFASLRILIDTINTYIQTWNQTAKPFIWTATPDQIITRVSILHRDFKKLLDNNTRKEPSIKRH
jgi:transposase